MENAERQASAEALNPIVAEPLRRRLGELADYATALAAAVEQQPALDTLGSLKELHDSLGDTIAALRSDIQGRLPEGVYPDTPMYNGILPGSEFETLAPENPKSAIHIFIISNNHIYCPETGKGCELSGDVLYLFNMLLKYQRQPQRTRTFINGGYRKSRTANGTKTRFRSTLLELKGLLAAVMPQDFSAVVEEGNPQLLARMLHPDIVVEDVRHNQEYAQLVPPPVAPLALPEVPAVVPGAAKGGLNVTHIATAAGVPIHRVSTLLSTTFGDEYNDFSSGGEKAFPVEFAIRLVAALKAEEDKMHENMLPGYVRLAKVIGQALQQGARYTTAEAVSVLRLHSFTPQKLYVQRNRTDRGGIWCVQENGALAALLAHKSAAKSESKSESGPEPVAAPPQETEPQKPKPELELAPSGNTLSGILHFLNNTEMHVRPFSLRELREALDTDRVRHALDGSSFTTGKFSYYGATKIIEEAKRKRGL